MDDDFDPADFPPPKRTEPCSLYLISPQDVGGSFPDRLKSVVSSDAVSAFQLRVKDVGEHELARLAEPLQRICADAGVAFISASRTATFATRGCCSVRKRRSASLATTAGISRWTPEKPARIMSRSAPSIRLRPSLRTIGPTQRS